MENILMQGSLVEKIAVVIKVLYVIGAIVIVAMMVRSAKRNKKNPWLWSGITAFIAVAIGYAMATKPSSAGFVKAMGGQGDLTDTHLIIKWPETPKTPYFQGQLQMDLRIPRAYLGSNPVSVDEKGVQSVFIRYEIPSGLPWQGPPPPADLRERPWEQYKAGALEEDGSKKYLRKKFLLKIDRGGPLGYAYRMIVRQRGLSDRYMRDSDVVGLERYSLKICYSEEQLKDPQYQKFLAAKESNDASPNNCLLHRYDAILVSPPTVTTDDEGIVIECSSTCTARFSVTGRGVEIVMKHSEVANWGKIVEPSRKMIKNFIVDSSLPSETGRAAIPTK